MHIGSAYKSGDGGRSTDDGEHDAPDGRVHDIIQSGLSAVAHGAACAGRLLAGFGPAAGPATASLERGDDGGLVVPNAPDPFVRRRGNAKLAHFAVSPIKRAGDRSATAGASSGGGKRGRVTKEALPAATRKNRSTAGGGNRAIPQIVLDDESDNDE